MITLHMLKNVATVQQSEATPPEYKNGNNQNGHESLHTRDDSSTLGLSCSCFCVYRSLVKIITGSKQNCR